MLNTTDLDYYYIVIVPCIHSKLKVHLSDELYNNQTAIKCKSVIS